MESLPDRPDHRPDVRDRSGAAPLECRDVAAMSDAGAELRPGVELDRDTHRDERNQDVREENRRVEAEPLDRLRGHLRAELRRAADLEERVLLPDGPVFGKVTARLAHDPDRGLADRLVAARAEKGVGRSQRRSLCHSSPPIDSSAASSVRSISASP